jgi:hypothetical protein
MTSALTFRALGALQPVLQALARAHARQYPVDSLDDLISELAVAALELADRGTDASTIYSRARSRMRRCPVPDDHIAPSCFPLFFARDVLRTLIAEMEAENKSSMRSSSNGGESSSC